MSDEEIAEVLKVADELAKWSADVYAYAQDEAVTKGKKWAGFKLVEGRSNRKYTDEEEVAQAAVAAGYTDIYKKTLIGITEIGILHVPCANGGDHERLLAPAEREISGAWPGIRRGKRRTH